MCGIVAYVGPKDAAPILLEGLQRLEYRGYDSAGVVISNKGLKMRKVKGRVADLAAVVPARFKGGLGIGHTRWATHGAPSDVNAHPHLSTDERIAVVHNGIIENADELRAKLEADGAVFLAATDTEVLSHLIARTVVEADSLEEAVRAALKRIVGTYGIAVIDAQRPGEVVV